MSPQKFLFVLSCFCVSNSYAQYYLNDIVNAERSEKQFALMKQLNIRKTATTSFDPDGSKTENFELFQELDKSTNRLSTYSRSNYTGTSVLTSTFNNDGRLASVIDSSSSIVNKSVYTYRTDGKLQELKMLSGDSAQYYAMTEQHVFEYNASGQPQSMLRIKNNTDSTHVVFVASENGKPGEEQWWNNNRKTETWFYYYDTQGRITDVARYNARAKRILPDYVYEYDNAGNISQQTTVQPSTGQYRIWKYTYDSRGLKIREDVLNKYKQPEGRIEYSYQ